MTVLTVRGLGEELAAALRREAKGRGISMNTLALQLLSKGLGLNSEPTLHRDLDDLAGRWTGDQLAEFMAASADFERIDAGLWE